MSTFPLLETGAVTQYPAYSGSAQSVSVVRFLDASDQRWRSQGRAFRRWQINLQLLSDNEVTALEAFFEGHLGEYMPFVFTDPFTGESVPNCRLGDAEMTTQYDGPNSGATAVWIVETNG
jgi:phage-related protein